MKRIVHCNKERKGQKIARIANIAKIAEIKKQKLAAETRRRARQSWWKSGPKPESG